MNDDPPRRPRAAVPDPAAAVAAYRAGRRADDVAADQGVARWRVYALIRRSVPPDEVRRLKAANQRRARLAAVAAGRGGGTNGGGRRRGPNAAGMAAMEARAVPPPARGPVSGLDVKPGRHGAVGPPGPGWRDTESRTNEREARE